MKKELLTYQNVNKILTGIRTLHPFLWRRTACKAVSASTFQGFFVWGQCRDIPHICPHFQRLFVSIIVISDIHGVCPYD